jgi:hypothetical protein
MDDALNSNWFTTVPDHLCISSTLASGRGLYVAPHCRLERGQVALSTSPTAVCISSPHQRFTCACCLGRTANATSPEEPIRLQRKCPICKSASWCSRACQEQSAARHEIECPLLARLKLNRSIKKDEREHIVILASTLATMGSCSDVSGTSRITLEHQDSASKNSQVWLQEILSLVEQDWNKPGSKKCMRVMHDAAAKVHGWCGVGGACPPVRHLQQSLQTGPMNDVGLWDETGESIGRCVAPIFALTNHSCLPNCAQIISNGHVQLIALCDIEAGQELTHSYVNLHACDRQQTMVQSWQFNCHCVRCKTPMSPLISQFDMQHVCSCGGVVLNRMFATPNEEKEECLCNKLHIV